MAEISWIKLSTGLPDNKKIKRIRKLPEGDKVILFWVFLLARAGESNQSGGIFLTDTMPYQEEDLAADFDFNIEFVQFALITLEKYSMITRYQDILFIKNWEEYQSIEGLEKVKEQNRIRQARYKEKQRQLTLGNVTTNVTANVSGNAEVTESNATDIDIDKELELDKEIDKKKDGAPSKTKAKPTRHKYGEYKNVLLSDQELEKLKSEFPSDWQKRIENVSEYCAASGKTYKNYLAVIRKWAKKDNTNQNDRLVQRKQTFNNKRTRSESYVAMQYEVFVREKQFDTELTLTEYAKRKKLKTEEVEELKQYIAKQGESN